MTTPEGPFLCPVCGFAELYEPAWRHGSGSLEICRCCGTQFGYQDIQAVHGVRERFEIHDDLRAKWIADGMRWTSCGIEDPPTGWDPQSQLARLLALDRTDNRAYGARE
jgi:hypothetical protein